MKGLIPTAPMATWEKHAGKALSRMIEVVVNRIPARATFEDIANYVALVSMAFSYCAVRVYFVKV